MKTIKVIDLFQKKVDGKQLPQIIKIRDHIFKLDEEKNDIEEMYKDGYLYWLRNQEKYNIILEDEVEIIEEEKEIKNLGYQINGDGSFWLNGKKYNSEPIKILSRKLIELIDAVNELKRGN